jgi:hypothetical protein
MAVLAFALAACSGSAAKWPNSGEARETLTSKYDYHFVHYNATWRAAKRPKPFRSPSRTRAEPWTR